VWFVLVGILQLRLLSPDKPKDLIMNTCRQGRIKLFGAPRQWKHFRPLFQAVFLSGVGGIPPRQSNTTPPSPKTVKHHASQSPDSQTPRLPVPRQSNTTPLSPKTEITNILFYIWIFASIIKF